VREKEYLSAMLDASEKGMRGRLVWMGECVLSHVFSAVEQFGRGCSSRRQIRAVMQLSFVGHRFNSTVELVDDYATSTSALPFEKFLCILDVDCPLHSISCVNICVLLHHYTLMFNALTRTHLLPLGSWSR
jgi:hypothetical protein